ncbi:unnamed protein product [Ilex paraguariensis]|uniref:Uncharacterized protein n=1 Tax=Ilex paraguariensis TaxID=185542 RepID=A0ABC8RF68_9AQUA
MVADYLARKGVLDKADTHIISSISLPSQARALLLQDQRQTKIVRQKKSWVHLDLGMNRKLGRLFIAPFSGWLCLFLNREQDVQIVHQRSKDPFWNLLHLPAGILLNFQWSLHWTSLQWACISSIFMRWLFGSLVQWKSLQTASQDSIQSFSLEESLQNLDIFLDNFLRSSMDLSVHSSEVVFLQRCLLKISSFWIVIHLKLKRPLNAFWPWVSLPFDGCLSATELDIHLLHGFAKITRFNEEILLDIHLQHRFREEKYGLESPLSCLSQGRVFCFLESFSASGQIHWAISLASVSVPLPYEISSSAFQLLQLPIKSAYPLTINILRQPFQLPYPIVFSALSDSFSQLSAQALSFENIQLSCAAQALSSACLHLRPTAH